MGVLLAAVVAVGGDAGAVAGIPEGGGVVGGRGGNPEAAGLLGIGGGEGESEFGADAALNVLAEVVAAEDVVAAAVAEEPVAAGLAVVGDLDKGGGLGEGGSAEVVEAGQGDGGQTAGREGGAVVGEGAVELAGGLPVAVEFEAAGLLVAGGVGEGLAAEIGGGGEVPGGGGAVEQEAGGDAFEEGALGGHGTAPGGVAFEDPGALGLDSGESVLGLLRVAHAQERARDLQQYDFANWRSGEGRFAKQRLQGGNGLLGVGGLGQRKRLMKNALSLVLPVLSVPLVLLVPFPEQPGNGAAEMLFGQRLGHGVELDLVLGELGLGAKAAVEAGVEGGEEPRRGLVGAAEGEELLGGGEGEGAALGMLGEAYRQGDGGGSGLLGEAAGLGGGLPLAFEGDGVAAQAVIGGTVAVVAARLGEAGFLEFGEEGLGLRGGAGGPALVAGAGQGDGDILKLWQVRRCRLGGGSCSGQ